MKLIFTLIVIYLVVVLAMTIGQRRMMYYPHKDLLSPAEHGLTGVEAITLDTADGESLVAWQLPAAPSMPTILYFHGNGGHLAFRTAFFEAAKQQGYGVLMVSYRGFGTSSGSPSEQGFYADAYAAYAYLSQRAAKDEIIIYGESLGTGVAVELARSKPARALVLQAPYTSITEVASNIYWWIPVRWVLKDRFDSINKAQDIAMPAIIFAATEDRVVPASYAKELYAAFNQPKRYVEFEGIGHNDFPPDKILSILRNFEQAGY